METSFMGTPNELNSLRIMLQNEDTQTKYFLAGCRDLEANS